MLVHHTSAITFVSYGFFFILLLRCIYLDFDFRNEVPKLVHVYKIYGKIKRRLKSWKKNQSKTPSMNGYIFDSVVLELGILSIHLYYIWLRVEYTFDFIFFILLGLLLFFFLLLFVLVLFVLASASRFLLLLMCVFFFVSFSFLNNDACATK